jgi:hypothetical protein
MTSEELETKRRLEEWWSQLMNEPFPVRSEHDSSVPKTLQSAFNQFVKTGELSEWRVLREELWAWIENAKNVNVLVRCRYCGGTAKGSSNIECSKCGSLIQRPTINSARRAWNAHHSVNEIK